MRKLAALAQRALGLLDWINGTSSATRAGSTVWGSDRALMHAILAH